MMPVTTFSQIFPRLRAAPSACLAGRDGSLTILSACMAAIVALAGLVAVDLARIDLAQQRLQSAVDAATLGSSRGMAEDDLDGNARKLFAANFPPGYLGAAVDDFTVQVSSDATGLQALTIVSTIDLPSITLSFGRRLGFGVKRLHASATAQRRVRTTELAMVLDNTGSLAGQPIKDLRTAAQNLSDTLFNGAEQVPGLYVAIVPYVATVNIGTQHTGWVVDPATRTTPPKAWSDYSPSTWKGCVRAESAPNDQTDATIAQSGKLTPFFWESASDNKWPQSGKVKETPANGNTGYGPNLGCGPPITPLTASRTVVNNAITKLDAWNRGGTMANVGLVWGWRALSPRWRGAWLNADGTPIPAAYPLDYNLSYNNKVIVLMTDGQNGWNSNDDSAYGRLNANTMGATSSNATSTINTRMLNACTALKNAGVVIFTVTFGSVDATTRTRYTNCASPTGMAQFPGQKYFNAPSGDDLRNAFKSIAGQLTELRLVK